MFVPYLTELVDFSTLNLHGDVGSYTLYGVNTLLTNTLNRYHPLVFYASILMFLSPLLTYLVSGFTPPHFQSAESATSLSVRGWEAIRLNLLSLWMGSWWALQEGTWGGWWNWDSSEVFGLLISVSLVSILHTLNTPSTQYQLRIKYVSLVSVVFISYFFIQLNFELASHNFGAKFFFFFNNNLFFLELLLLSTLVAFASSRLAVLAHTLTGLFRNGNHGSIKPSYCGALRFIPSAVVAYWVLWSYRPLVNYFIWNFLELNLFNTDSSLQPINSLLLLVLLGFTRLSIQGSWFAILIFLTHSVNWLWPLVLNSARFNLVFLLHSALVLFSLINLTALNLVINVWLSNTVYGYLKITDLLEFDAPGSLSADSSVWEVVQGWHSFSSPTSDTWGTYALTNAPSGNFFSLELSQNFLQNVYNLGGVYAHSYLNLELPHTGALNTLSVIIFALLKWLSAGMGRTRVL